MSTHTHTHTHTHTRTRIAYTVLAESVYYIYVWAFQYVFTYMILQLKNRTSNVHFSEMVRRSSLSRASSPGSSKQSTHPLAPSVSPSVDRDSHRGSDGWLDRKNSGSQQGSHRSSHETNHPQQQMDAEAKKKDVNVHENRLQIRKDHRPSEASLCSDASDLTPILKNRRSSGAEDEGHGSFTKLSDAVKKKWRRVSVCLVMVCDWGCCDSVCVISLHTCTYVLMCTYCTYILHEFDSRCPT